MDCKLIEPELIGFHFGTLEDETRRAVELHLPGCATCVRAFLDTKRTLEAGGRGELPSEAARARLRQAVAREIALRRRPLRRSLALSLAVAAVAVGIFVSGALRRPPASGITVPAVDTVRTASTSLDVL